MASPVWQYFKLSEKDNKIAVCNVCVKQKPCSSTRCDGPGSGAKHTLRVTPNTLSYLIYLWNKLYIYLFFTVGSLITGSVSCMRGLNVIT